MQCVPALTSCMLLNKPDCKNEAVWKRVPIKKKGINLLQFLKVWYFCIRFSYIFCALAWYSFSITNCHFKPKSFIPSQVILHIYNLLGLVSGRAILIRAFQFTTQRKKREAHSPCTHIVTELGRNYHYPAPCIKLSLRAPFIQ